MIDYDIKKVEKTDKFSPNVIQIVNAPKLQIPTRLYIFKEGLEETFGSLENAIDYSVNRMNENPKVHEFFQLGFVFGNNPPDKDIFWYPFTYSNSKGIRSTPRLIKNRILQSWIPRVKIDEFSRILGDEQLFLRQNSLENYINNFPKSTILKYLD